MPTDRRVRYTQAAIKESFLDLMQNKHHARITVTEICAAADMNRATFYRHYRDPIDLLEKMEQEIIDRLIEKREAFERDLESELISLFEQMKQDCRIYDVLFSDNGDAAFPGRLLDAFWETINQDTMRQRPELSETQSRWLYTFASQGCAAVIREWTSSGMAEDPAEPARFLHRIIAGTQKIGT